MSNLNIGPHLSISKGFLKTAQFAKTINANTFQYFSRNPRGGAKRPLDLEDINAYLNYAKENGFATLLCKCIINSTQSLKTYISHKRLGKVMDRMYKYKRTNN